MPGRSAKRVMERRRGTTRRIHSERNRKDLRGGKRERMLEWSATDDLRRYFSKQDRIWRVNGGNLRARQMISG